MANLATLEYPLWSKLGLTILEVLGLNKDDVYQVTVDCSAHAMTTIRIEMGWAQNEPIEIDWQQLDMPTRIEIVAEATKRETE